LGPCEASKGQVIVKLDYQILKSIANAFFGAFVGRKTRPA